MSTSSISDVVPNAQKPASRTDAKKPNPAISQKTLLVPTKTAVSLSDKKLSTLGSEELREYIHLLQDKARQMEALQQANVPKRYQILYCFEHQQSTKIYLDCPTWTQGGSGIRSRKPLHNLDLFLERNKDISFLVYRTFDNGGAARRLITPNTPSDRIKFENPDAPQPWKESIHPVAGHLYMAVKRLLQTKPKYATLLEHYENEGIIEAPYLFVYHNRQRWENLLKQLPVKPQEQLKRFGDYVFQHYGEEYEAAEASFSKGLVSPALIKYLFTPGEVLISRKSNEHLGHVTKSWPNFSFRMSVDPEEDDADKFSAAHAYLSPEDLGQYLDVLSASDDDVFVQKCEPLPHRRTSHAPKKEKHDACSIDAWRWGFDTIFKRQYETLTIQFPRSKADKSFHTHALPIQELDVYPLRFATRNLAEKLKHRGKMFWLFRERCLVSYVEQEGEVADNRVSSLVLG